MLFHGEPRKGALRILPHGPFEEEGVEVQGSGFRVFRTLG